MRVEAKWTTEEAERAIRNRFSDERVSVVDISAKQYPEETIFVVFARGEQLEQAARIGNELDRTLENHGFNGFVTVRQAADPAVGRGARVAGVHDDHAVEFIRVLQARARTSEAQPALLYVPDSAATIASATAARHHLVFGRRGAGKTALLLEAKRRLEEGGALTVWINVQPYRWSEAGVAAGAVMQAMLEIIEVHYRDAPRAPRVLSDAAALSETISGHLARNKSPDVRSLLPQVQRTLRRFTSTTGKRLFIFLDDYYFVTRPEQVELLDSLHACVRDADAWLKIATIRHLTRWFDPSKQMGLQIGHDADALDLDVTLQDPRRAKVFLERVLRNYGESVSIPTLGRIFSAEALDRLLLASGSVPRDYLVLASNAIAKARERSKARTVGVQDVNKTAGDAALVKLQELDEDLSPNTDWAIHTRAALKQVLAFCLDDTHWTYFRVDFRDKEARRTEYDFLASLMDLRMIHLLNPSVSDESRAGEKSEVYMLDLSQYSGERLKKYLHVLDFVSGYFVLKETGRKGSDRVGDTPKKLIAILRRAPVLSLSALAEQVT